jgi:Meiotic cell cortex C-terminal pleckstrin homology
MSKMAAVTAAMDSPPQSFITTGVTASSDAEDPFVIVNGSGDHLPHPHPHRYSAFDTQIFSLNASSSPSQAKRAIEAHLAETNRRLEDTGRLGSSLVQQRAELAEKLKEVEKRKDDAELPPELRERLAEIEKDYNEVGRETARALLAPRARVVSADDKPGESSPAVFSSQANSSPSKVSVPSRKQRNQPSSRADIQFAADISSSLLVQVRQLQAALAERDESLKAIVLEKSKLETEAEGFSQRLRALDESEQRYKDENWNLETQTHEMIAAAKEAGERENKLSASLAAALAEKNRVQNDLDEVRVAHGKLSEEHAAAVKQHDSELHTLRRNMDNVDIERDSLQRKVDELTSQNRELATAIATRSRARENDADADLSLNEEHNLKDSLTPEHSPPPSPTKATPRHGALESETLKSSLHHAHRMIQNLKGNIHREKTEKIELKRMLQDARDELEQRRAESGSLNSGSRRQRTKPEIFKKPARPEMLGGSRRARTDIEVDEHDWEDNVADGSPSHAAATRALGLGPQTAAGNTTDFSDAYHTANETEGAFETAHERENTESEEFQTGAESLAGESTDESTETETEGRGDRRSTVRASRPSMLGNVAGNRNSYLSTASTSAGEEEVDFRTPVQSQPLRYRLRMGRGASARQSRSQADSVQQESLAFAQDSPMSSSTSPAPAEQSLFAELGEFNGGGSEFSTPGRASVFSSQSTPAAANMSGRKSLTDSDPAPASERTKMVDSATMTEPWKPETPSKSNGPPLDVVAGAAAGYSLHGHDLAPPSPSDFPLPPSLASSPSKSEMHYTPLRGFQESPGRGVPSFITPPKTIWDEAQDQGAAGSREGNIASSPLVPSFGFSQASSQSDLPSAIRSESAVVPSMVQFSFSPIIFQETVPIVPLASEMAAPLSSSSAEEQQPSTSQKAFTGLGLVGSLTAALGLSRDKQPETVIAEDGTSQAPQEVPSDATPDQPLPLKDISGNAGIRSKSLEKPVPIAVTDQASQTLLTAEEIDDVLRKTTTQASQNSGLSKAPALKPIITGVVPRSTSRSRTMIVDPDLPLSLSPVKRPGSSTSLQGTNAITNVVTNASTSPVTGAVSIAAQHPPLPADHRTAIAKAGGRLSTSAAEPSEPASTSAAGMMGPPLAPASAYRRPRTSVDHSIASPTRGSITPRQVHRERDRPRTGSQMSRRSSVSSFASELDERFNIRTDGVPANPAFESGPSTDPRMIQAITQTMIGEFLWKYTRKPGRPEMSNTRHRRYFWVHPYTRTLYWSEQDPQAAGGKELKAKSVAIESVRVVTDDNPMPLGLHRKSLEVVTPGRKVKFTAGTGNRHETWFNALSYLLMRAQDDGIRSEPPSAIDGGGLTAEEVNEFNPGAYGRNSRINGPSRASLSSYNSQTTRGTASHQARASIRHTGLAHASYSASGNAISSVTPTLTSDHDPNRTLRQASVSRFSHMFKPSSIRHSFSMSRRSLREADLSGAAVATIPGGGHDGEIYNAEVVSEGGLDSAEELRREVLRREREGGGKLENVRACCDGEFCPSSNRFLMELVVGGWWLSLCANMRPLR